MKVKNYLGLLGLLINLHLWTNTISIFDIWVLGKVIMYTEIFFLLYTLQRFLETLEFVLIVFEVVIKKTELTFKM